MANARTIRNWNAIWEKLQAFLGFNSVESPFASLVSLNDDTTIYVSTTGSDTNSGTSGQPFLTIQGALNYLLSFDQLNGRVTVSVGAGTFDGFRVPDYRFGPNGSLLIKGATTVLASGTITSSPSGGVIIDSNADFSSIPIGSMLSYSGNTNALTYPTHVIYQVVGTTRLEVATSVLPSGTYEIHRLDTIVLPNCFGVAGSTTSAAIVIDGQSASPAGRLNAGGVIAGVVEIANLKITATEAFTRTIFANTRGLCLRGLDITCGGTSGTSSQLAGEIRLDGCIHRLEGTGRSAISASSFSPLNLQCIRSVFYGAPGSASAIGLNFANTSTSVTSTITASIAMNLSTVLSVSNVGAATTNITTNINATNCGTVFSLAGRGSTALTLPQLTFTSPTANTTWISVSKGHTVNVPSSTTANGTTEISLDGATTTIAAVRALSPRAYPATPNAYGTVIYE